MATITVTNQKSGSTGNYFGLNKPMQFVIDLGKAAADTVNAYSTGDTLLCEVVDLPADIQIKDLHAEIVEALPASSTTNIGTTSADPDEYVDGQTDVAVGQFTGYVAVTYPEIITTAKTLYVQVANAGAITSGKIAVMVDADIPLSAVPERATYRDDYPNA